MRVVAFSFFLLLFWLSITTDYLVKGVDPPRTGSGRLKWLRSLSPVGNQAKAQWQRLRYSVEEQAAKRTGAVFKRIANAKEWLTTPPDDSDDEAEREFKEMEAKMLSYFGNPPDHRTFKRNLRDFYDIRERRKQKRQVKTPPPPDRTPIRPDPANKVRSSENYMWTQWCTDKCLNKYGYVSRITRPIKSAQAEKKAQYSRNMLYPITRGTATINRIKAIGNLIRTGAYESHICICSMTEEFCNLIKKHNIDAKEFRLHMKKSSRQALQFLRAAMKGTGLKWQTHHALNNEIHNIMSAVDHADSDFEEADDEYYEQQDWQIGKTQYSHSSTSSPDRSHHSLSPDWQDNRSHYSSESSPSFSSDRSTSSSDRSYSSSPRS